MAAAYAAMASESFSGLFSPWNPLPFILRQHQQLLRALSLSELSSYRCRSFSCM
jgi:hypothetical protein